MKRLTIIYFLTTIVCFSIHAQPLSKESTAAQCCISSPNATSIAKYGDIPMNYHTGRANIIVPIYQTSQRGVDLDVSMSYDTGGIIATSLPGWTGHNWTLNAGGAITRVRNGFVDEFKFSPYDPSTFRNNFDNPEKLQQYVTEYYNNSTDYDQKIETLVNNIVVGDYECMPDVFYFNFMGKSGRFFYGPDGQWKVLSDNNICVVFDVHDDNNYILPFFKYHKVDDTTGGKQRKTIKGFTLIDEDGTKYIFGDKSSSNGETQGLYETRASAIEYSQPFFTAVRLNDSSSQDRESMTASSWYLTEVKDRFDNTLYEFEYERGMFMVQASYMKEDTWETYNNHTYPQRWDNFNCALCLNSPVYLSCIKMPMSNDSISFKQDNNRILGFQDFYSSFHYDMNKLRSLAAISDNHNEIFYFLQSSNNYVLPFQNPMATYADKLNCPLKSMGFRPLKNVEIYTNGKKQGSYDFEYTDSSQRLFLKSISVTNGGARKNGYRFRYNNPELLPKEYIYIGTDDWGYYNNCDTTNQSPNLELTKYGMLKEITYPTGGLTEIEYGQNHYSSYFDRERNIMQYNPGLAGGLTVTSLRNYEDSTKTRILSSKTFDYCDGQLYSQPKHVCNWVSLNGNVMLHISNYNSIVPLCNSFGPHIGYSSVYENQEDGSYTRYYYQNIDICRDEPPVISTSPTPSPFDVFSDRGYKRGKITQIDNFDNRGYLMSGILYMYRTDDVESKFVYNTNIQMRQAVSAGSSASGAYYTGGVYKMYYPKYDVVKMLVKTRHEADIIADLTEYEKRDTTVVAFNETVDIRQCMSETVTRGEDILTTVYGYPNYDAGVNAVMTSQFYIPATSVRRYYNGMLLDGKKTIFGFCGQVPVPMYDLAFKSDESVADTVARYISYSPTFRLMEMTDVHGISHKYFWDSKDRLTATAANSSPNISVNSNAATSEGVVNSPNPLEVFGSEPTNTTSCIYNERGLISSITSANRLTSRYYYDTFGRLASVKDRDENVVSEYDYNYRTGAGEAAIVDDEAETVGAAYEATVITSEVHAPQPGVTGGISNFSYDVMQKTVTVDYYVSPNAASASLKVLDGNQTTRSSRTINEYGLGHMVLSVSSLPVGLYHVCLFVDEEMKDSKTIYIPY